MPSFSFSHCSTEECICSLTCCQQPNSSMLRTFTYQNLVDTSVVFDYVITKTLRAPCFCSLDEIMFFLAGKAVPLNSKTAPLGCLRVPMCFLFFSEHFHIFLCFPVEWWSERTSDLDLVNSIVYTSGSSLVQLFSTAVHVKECQGCADACSCLLLITSGL